MILPKRWTALPAVVGFVLCIPATAILFKDLPNTALYLAGVLFAINCAYFALESVRLRTDAGPSGISLRSLSRTRVVAWDDIRDIWVGSHAEYEGFHHPSLVLELRSGEHVKVRACRGHLNRDGEPLAKQLLDLRDRYASPEVRRYFAPRY